MKTVIAYALVIIGVPVFGGLLTNIIVGVPLSLLLPMPLRIRLMPYLEIFGGFGAALTAIYLFRLFSLHPTFAVPLIIATWLSLYFISYKQRLNALASWLVGLFVGWAVIPNLLGI